METKSSVLVHLLFLFVVADVLRVSTSETTLYLLNVLPYPDDRPFAGWDRGFELIPAGNLAIKQINNRSDLLPGYRLELVDIESEACGVSIINTGYVNFYRHLVQPNLLVVGVVGLFCSTVTATVSRIANHPKIDYIQVAGSTSPWFQNVTVYPQLYRTVSSATIFNRASLRLMEKFSWKRISLIHGNGGVFFLTTADDFASEVNADPTLELVTRIPTSLSYISDAFANLKNAGARIVYALLTPPEAANLMCEAYQHRFLWPGYVYIFHDRTFQEFVNESETTCDESELTTALEGSFLLQYRLHAEPDDTLVSGWTYEEYQKNYQMRLAELVKDTGMKLQTDNSWANVLYDEVWAIALALNNSQETLNSINVTLTDYALGQSIITDTIASNLKNISFQGAAGYIKFDSNHEATSTIDIFQVQGGQPELVGVYNPNEDNLTINDSMLSTVPADRFEVVYDLLPQWLTITIFCICGLAYIMTTIILVLFLYWRNEPEIKATSPYLSLVMFAGCYLLYTAITFQTISKSFAVGFNMFTAACNIDSWFGFIGFNLIFGTLFVRLLRINHIFRVFQKTSKIWSDQFLFLIVLLICSGMLIILILWTTTDILYLEEKQMYISSAQLSYYRVKRGCSSINLGIWVTTAHAYNGVIILLVIFLAVQTRHIKRRNFKDTKKVNAYIFTVVVILAIAVPLWYIFSRTQFEVGGHISSVIAYLSIAILCQFFLFAPKVLPLFNKHKVCSHL